MSNAIAVEAQQIVRQAAGNTAGKTVVAQQRAAEIALGYTAGSWRIREAWYGRAGGWSAQAIRDLQDRYLAWRDREEARQSRQDAIDRIVLQQTRERVLADLAQLEARLAGFSDPGSPDPE